MRSVLGDPTEGCEHIEPRAVYLYYKTQTSSEYKRPVQMFNAEENNWTATIAGAEIGSAKMLYYFRAVGPTQETTEPDGPKEDNKSAFEFVISI